MINIEELEKDQQQVIEKADVDTLQVTAGNYRHTKKRLQN